MDWSAVEYWAARDPGETIEPSSLSPAAEYRRTLIECARLAVARHERAEGVEWKGTDQPEKPEPPAESTAPVEPAPDPLAVDLRAAGRVYRRALVAIREVERIQEAIGKGYPRPADSAADIARRLRLFARSVATDLGDDFELVERKSAELEIEHREQADVWERESTAAMLERLLPGETGAILSCLVRGCFQHWSPEDGIPEDLSFTDD